MPTLLIADDHPLFRAALRGAAADAVARLQVLEAESLDGVLAALESRADVDLVLLDLHMPTCRPLLMLKLPSRSGSLIRPFQPTVVRGFSKYTRITISSASPRVSRRGRSRRA